MSPYGTKWNNDPGFEQYLYKEVTDKMAENEQNAISNGLDAAQANADDEQSQQQVEQLASQLNDEAGTSQVQTEVTNAENME
jgi:uncharacterized FlaG/YvyC family protein